MTDRSDEPRQQIGLFAELRRRNVFRVGIAYLLLAWIAIQVTDTVAPALNLPDWTLAFVTWMSILGLPLALFFAWAFELTPEGLKREKEVDRSESITGVTGRRIDFVVIGLLLIAVVFLVVDNYVFDDAEEVVADDAAAPSESTGSQQAYDSIGVLPFVNMSDDPSQDYFSDGIAEELLNTLAKLKHLQVAARTSSFAFKGQNQDITDIGNKLKVDTVLEGSVRKSGSRLRITAQLIDVSNGYHLWSETYDRELTDIFAIQDEIAAAIIDALLVHFDTGETAAVAKSQAPSMSAYDAYLQGRHQMRTLGAASVREALASFRAATEADPDFAAAWAARALAVIMLREDDFREGIPLEEAHLLARSAIDRALEIDPMLAEAYVAEGFLLADDYRYEEALLSLEKAVEINPNLAEAWQWRSRILGRFGRIREARENMLMALELDPHNPVTAAIAANLATDFYDPEFFTAVERSTSQFSRAKQILEGFGWTELEPMTKERYESIVASPEMTDRRLARLNYIVLKEIDEAGLAEGSRRTGEFLMWQYMGIDEWDKAQAMYDELSPERQQAALNLEMLSVMQTSQGKCEEALQSLDLAHGGQIRIHGMIPPNVKRSNPNLALNRVYCLRQLGRSAEADKVLSMVREYVDTLRENATRGYFVLDAKLRILDEDIEGALDILEAARLRNELDWIDRYDPIMRTLGGEARFKALFAEIDDDIDALRAELGMGPAEL
jgi:TolB-like protein